MPITPFAHQLPRLLAPALLGPILLAACGQGHTHEDEAAGGAAEPAGGAVTLWTDSTELFMEHPALIVGAPDKFAVHLTDLTDFAPLRSGRITLRFEPKDGGDPVLVTQQAPRSPGIYGPAPEFSRAGTYDLTITVESPQARDVLRVPDLRVYASAEEAPKEVAGEAAGISFLKEQQWKTPGFATAFATTGHHEESYRILGFLAEAQEGDGGWEARYRADGTPVLDGRPAQLDAVGWFPWAVWYWSRTADGEESTVERTRALWPAVRSAADTAAASLGPNGLPPGGPDYWETSTWRPNLGTAAPLRTGLRAAADLADDLGHPDDARRYADAVARLDRAIDREFAPHGYPRTTNPGSGADAAVTFLAPPFAPFESEIEQAVQRTEERLAAPNGGLLPGENWEQDPSVAWTPETAFFALAASAGGNERAADRKLRWLMDHRTSLGSFPEKVNGDGEPCAAAPLGWTSAAVLLALAAEEDPLPVPAAVRAGEEAGGSPLGSLGGVLLGAGALVAATRVRWRP